MAESKPLTQETMLREALAAWDDWYNRGHDVLDTRAQSLSRLEQAIEALREGVRLVPKLREALERIAAIDAAIEARKAGGTEPVMAMMVDAYPVFRAALAAPEPLPAEPIGAAIAASVKSRGNT